MSKTKTCSECGMEIPQKAKICPHCRCKQKEEIGCFSILLYIFFSIFVFGGGMKMCSNDATDKQTEEVSSPKSTEDNSSNTTVESNLNEEIDIRTDELGSTEMNNESDELYNDNEISIENDDVSITSNNDVLHQSAFINDPDGFTNVRATPDSQSEIVTKIVDGERFFFDDVPNSNWVKVYRTADAGAECIGYMHKSCVVPLGSE